MLCMANQPTKINRQLTNSPLPLYRHTKARGAIGEQRRREEKRSTQPTYRKKKRGNEEPNFILLLRPEVSCISIVLMHKKKKYIIKVDRLNISLYQHLTFVFQIISLCL